MRHVWVVRWDVPVGEAVEERVLTYPAFNAVIEGTHDERTPTAGLFPPSGRVAVRRLEGAGWAVGMLLRPCAWRILLDGRGVSPRAVPTEGVLLADAPTERIADAMAQRSREAIVSAVTDWLLPYAALIDERDRLVNDACRLAEEEAPYGTAWRPTIERASELAARLGVAPRTLERTMREYLGLSPKWLIECRRLQAAAVTLYQEPETDLSALAGQLGYADYAHFSRRYRGVLGETPNATRRAGRARIAT
ncbi:hypothetical protein GCM10028798_04610 [Humibacter antri]